MDWVQDYLQVLGTPHKKASTPYLKNLMNAHRHVFPFENVGKLTFNGEAFVTADVESFLWRHRRYHTGGTCITLNLQFSRLLDALGFQVFFLKPGGDHMALLVRAPESGQPFYVDVGTPVPLLTPLPLSKHKQTRVPLFAGEKVILMAGEKEGEYTYIRTIADRIVDRKWGFSIDHRYQLHDFQDLIHRSYEPSAPYMQQLRCEKWCARKRRMLSLKNKELTIRTHTGGKIKRELKTRAELLEALVSTFSLPKLPAETALDKLEENGHLPWKEARSLSGGFQ
ncbi:arylamine N-acetyltransferase [Natribacillus halophilus]|uniref:Arylamine N-acetyltransferase n=1 Tax=Natribacillus halophilus TaxID=549003 RepID=A0A1G8NV88_9BACI|nr:arylamine N-acetyltransferase [Natribacillus halophilus]SDI83866.1 Arylamine N-acetyltransferase [Natribacillus halophilus]